MGKLEYLDALKRAMLGLTPEVQARTLAYYEQRFVDAANLGRSEEDVARELDDPKKIAMTLRASTHFEALTAGANANANAKGSGDKTQKKASANLPRMIVSAAGLAIFNLFMIVPAIVYSALLFALYVCALAFYVGGIMTTASGLAGTNELVLDWPARYLTVDPDSRGERQTRITIGAGDIQVTQDSPRGAEDGGQDEQGSSRRARSRVLRGAEAVTDGSLRISTEMDAESRTTQSAVGLGMVIGGIALFLVSLVVTRFTLVGLKRYFQMNRSLLAGH
jgi:uncharacterized membrane protein